MKVDNTEKQYLRLTPAQKKAMLKFGDGRWHSAYESRCHLGTLDALCAKGLLMKHEGTGSMLMPRTVTMYCATMKGYDYLRLIHAWRAGEKKQDEPDTFSEKEHP